MENRGFPRGGREMEGLIRILRAGSNEMEEIRKILASFDWIGRIAKKTSASSEKKSTTGRDEGRRGEYPKRRRTSYSKKSRALVAKTASRKTG